MDTKDKIYLDYAASTPVDERVIQAMLPYFDEIFGNPSSIHYFGQKAEAAVDQARQTVAGILHCQPEEVVFTSCGTESDNLALRGTALARREKSGADHILISPVEHPAVLQTARYLETYHHFKVELLPVDQYGGVDPVDVESSLRPETALVSVVYGNNEIGTINPVAEIGEICRRYSVPFHTDAVQAMAHLKIDVQRDRVDLLSIGAHKFYGPKGVGALYVREGCPIIPVQTGGKQEEGLRAGTHNVPYIVGMATAMRLTEQERQQRSERLRSMRDHLIDRVLKEIPRVRLTGHPVHRLPNHASFVFEGLDGNQLLMILDVAGFACSSGSACKVGTPKPSDVLTAIGLSPSWALGSLRISLGANTTPDDLEAFLQVLPEAVKNARQLMG